MNICDITVSRVIAEPLDLADLSDEQRAAVNAWLERTAADFFAQVCGAGERARIWVDENGQMQIELVNPLAIEAAPHPAAVAGGAKPRSGAADPQFVQLYRPIADCGY